MPAASMTTTNNMFQNETMKKSAVRVLFIGNSHTYFNDMPQLMKTLAADEGFDCAVTMLAHPGWFLAQHAAEPEARFNILCGAYDYVVLQEHAHPFGPEEKFHQAAAALNELIRRAGSIPVIYECWARKAEPEMQAHMNEVHEQVAAEIGALIAPVGKRWRSAQEDQPEMYAPDGEHASVHGSRFAAACIWRTIREDMEGTASRAD